VRRRSRVFPERRDRELIPSKVKFVRGVVGPVLVLATLLGVGYGAVAMLHSLPAHPSVKAVSMRFVNIQNSTISDWNMTLIDNSTVTAIMGMVCQRNYSTNDCNEIGPIYYATTPFYIEPGQAMTFELGVNTTTPFWEFHISFYGWPHEAPPRTRRSAWPRLALRRQNGCSTIPRATA
jgi:hypothetical protein